MRIQTISGVTMRYPDEIGFAFNPCLFVVDYRELACVAFSLTDGTTTQAVDFDAHGGRVYADLREFVQTLYSDASFGDINYNVESSLSPLGKDVTVAATAYSRDATTGERTELAAFSVSVFFVWGALAGDEVFNAYRRIKWFRNYPFTFGIYANATSSLIVNNAQVISLAGRGMYNVRPTYSGSAKKLNIYDYSGNIIQATFDDTFDLTFWDGDGVSRKLFEIDIDDCADDGFYLRWINRHGFVCYWLFKKGAEQYQAANGGEYLRNNLLDTEQAYGYNGGQVRRQSYTRQDIVPVCAPLVDRDTWDYLLDVITSPVVDLFRGYKADQTTPRWQAVTIQAGSYTKAMRTPLQDFAFNILMPETPTQSL